MTEHAPKVAALLAYESDALSAEGRARVEGHLAGCAACRETLASMRVYEELARDVRALPVPEVRYDRMELALRREARTVGRETRGAGRGILIGLALAAAAVLAVVLLQDRSGETVVEAPVLVPSEPAPTHAEREPITGEVTAVVDGVTAGLGDARAQVEIGADVREGTTLSTADPAEVHVRFYDGTGVVVGAGTTVRVAELRRGRVQLALDHGLVSSQVAHLGEGDAYEVHADPYVVRVRGTRFAVKREASRVGVTVDEGVVEVLRDGEVVATVRAPGRWQSSDGAGALGVGEVPAPMAVADEAASWPVLRLPSVEWVAEWHVGDRTLPPGSLAVRTPPGTLHVEGHGGHAKVWRAELVMGPDGQMIEAEAIAPAAPPVRTGTLAPELIAPVVRRGVDRLRACQRDVDRATNVWVVGSFTLRVTIGRTGEVRDAELRPVRVAGEVPPEFEACVLGQVRGWTFPPPTGGIVTFEQPLSYRTAPTRED